MVKEEMDKKHVSWCGKKKAYITERVRRTRSQLNFGDAFRTIENSSYSMMTDTQMPFLQHHMVIPKEDEPGKFDRMMTFANPKLLPLLRMKCLDLHIDATFDCAPALFYQCLILMVFDHQTGVHLAVFYCLMTHRTEELY